MDLPPATGEARPEPSLLASAGQLKASAAAETEELSTTVVRALGAIAAGIGIIGFVILCGGAITFVRLEAVGLPAVEGVARVPRETLIVAGAQVLVPAALLTIGVVMLLYALDLFFRLRDDRAAACDAVPLAAAEHERATEEAEERAEEDQRRDAVTTELQAALAAVASATTGPQGRAARRRFKAATLALKEADEERDERLTRLSRLTSAVGRASDHAHAQAQGRRVRRVLIGTAVLLVLAFVIAAVAFRSVSASQLVLVLALALATSMTAFAIFMRTDRFVPFGVVSFIAIGLVFGLTKFFSTGNNPQVAPAAVLQSGREPIAGFLVADTGDVLLLARRLPGTATMQMLVLPRRDVTDLVLGETTDPRRARLVALTLLTSLCKQHVEDALESTQTQSAHRARGARGTARDSSRQTDLATLCTDRERACVRDRLLAEQKAQLSLDGSRQTTADTSD